MVARWQQCHDQIRLLSQFCVAPDVGVHQKKHRGGLACCARGCAHFWEIIVNGVFRRPPIGGWQVGCGGGFVARAISILSSDGGSSIADPVRFVVARFWNAFINSSDVFWLEIEWYSNPFDVLGLPFPPLSLNCAWTVLVYALLSDFGLYFPNKCQNLCLNSGAVGIFTQSGSRKTDLILLTRAS